MDRERLTQVLSVVATGELQSISLLRVFFPRVPWSAIRAELAELDALNVVDYDASRESFRAVQPEVIE